jgi:hypothetical protein
MKLQKRLSNELEYFLDLIRQKTPFALARYADGEMMFLEGRPGAGIDGWFSPGKTTEFGLDLLMSLQHKEDFYFYGISCDQAPQDKEKYLNIIQPRDLRNLTFSNLFVNVNYLRFRKFIAALDEPVVLIVSKKCKGSSFTFLKIKDIIFVGDDPVEFWENRRSDFLSELNRVSKYRNTLFLISA